jgi:hypothetical protein
MKPFKTWTVLPHGKLVQLDDNLLSVSGEMPMPLVETNRRMTVVRLQNGQLVIFSAIALDELEMRALEDFGAPGYLIVPSDIHRMDARIWKERYPRLVVIAPAGARDKVEEVVHVDVTSADFGDPRVQLVIVPGTDEREAALVVESANGTTLVVNDLIFNVDDQPGIGGWLFKVMGFSGDEPKIPKVVQLKTVKDKVALRAQLEAWSQLASLHRIIVSHGEIVTRAPAAALAQMAAKLAA